MCERERRREGDARAARTRVPTVVIVTVSGFAPVESIVIVLPATRPVTLAILTFVAPAAAAADSVVVVDATSWTPLQPAFWLHE